MIKTQRRQTLKKSEITCKIHSMLYHRIFMLQIAAACN